MTNSVTTYTPIAQHLIRLVVDTAASDVLSKALAHHL